MPDDKDDKKKKYAVVPEKVTVPARPELASPSPPTAPDGTAHPDLATSVPDESPKAP